MSWTVDPATAFRHALAPEDRQRIPRYAALLSEWESSTLAGDLLLAAPATQRNPMLMLAALHFEARRGHPQLAELFRDISDIEPATWAKSVDLVLHADPHLITQHLHRRTQTNEIGRSASYDYLLRSLVDPDEELHLIDVGGSMGMNLFPDLVCDDSRTIGDPLRLTCEVKVPSPVVIDHYRVSRRTLVDSAPLDFQNADDREWLRACLWPEQPERLARFDAACAARASWPTIDTFAADATEGLRLALATSGGARPVILNSWAMAYFPADTQREFAALAREAVSEGALWISIENPILVSSADFPPCLGEPWEDGASAVWVAEKDHERHWGYVHPHGRWIQFVSPVGPKAWEPR